MICACGGAMTSRTSSTHDGVRLEFQECQACGRIGREELYQYRLYLGRGLGARRQFNFYKEHQTWRVA